MAHHAKAKKSEHKPSSKEKLKAIRKERKQKLQLKRARLVIKNLPFKATKENVHEHFSKFGEIEEVEILKREDGKLVGCGFVQFKLVQKAAKAQHHTNGKPFLGRDIIVNFAMAKNTYTEKVKQKEDKKEDNSDEVEVKEEEIKEEDIEDAGDLVIDLDETDDEVKKEIYDEVEKEMNDSDSEDFSEVEEVKEKQRERVQSHDVAEGKTIFIKNLPFSATNDDLKQVMIQFGPVYYALICIDKFTEHSKGTAFVKFVNQEDAEKALNAGTELTLHGSVLDCHKALDGDDMKSRMAQKEKEKHAPKDSRNLYLVKEGVILAGSKAAEGVSAKDMSKRLQLEQYKTQMLRNLNMYVSRERLVAHNLPATWDDKKLKTLFQKYSSPTAVIREARIMRNMKNVDKDGVGASKEFGFVTFTTHEDALTALRALNNNPEIFSADKRPIITFSIENKQAIRAKQNRLKKSKMKNPTHKEYDPKEGGKNKKVVDEKKKNKKFRDRKRNKKVEVTEKSQSEVGDKTGKFSGVESKPGIQKMRSRYKLKVQAKTHLDNLKKEKRKKKLSKKTLKEKKEEFTKQPKQKLNKKSGEKDNLSKLISKRRKQLNVTVPEKKPKQKWYSD